MAMKQMYSYEDCYKILNQRDKCSWSELRKTYKLLIQKCHPDRFKEGTAEKNAAEEKIKELNKAYQQLSKYYRKHNALPEIKQSRPASRFSSATQNATTSQPQAKHFNESPQNIAAKKTGRKTKASAAVVIFTVIIVLTLIYTDFDTPSTGHSEKTDWKVIPLNKNSKTQQNHPQAEHNKQVTSLANDSTVELKAITRRQFTYGSSIGSVIMIQGTPTKVEGDTWYYGESKVFFHDGVVQGWERKLGSPLNAGISTYDSTKKRSTPVFTPIR
jgi:curved DNA-binding protein CbpA